MSKAIQKTRKLDPRLKEAVTAAYKRGLAEGDRRASRQSQNRLLAELTEGRDAKTQQAITAAFDLGFMDSEREQCRHCRNKLVSAMQTTNSNLWEALNDLDKVEPIEGIILSFKETYEIVTVLREVKRKAKLRNILSRRAKEASHSLHFLLEQMEGAG